MSRRFHCVIAICLSTATFLSAEPVKVRIAAANLTSGRHQSYAPDLGDNAEGAGARILKGLRPDVVLIQEFNTDIPIEDWVSETFGPDFNFSRELDAEIPNGIISRFPIVESGEWDDPTQTNRDFAWARIQLPNGRSLWAVSLHWYSQRSEVRVKEAESLLQYLEAEVPEGDLLVVGGDLNTPSALSPGISVLSRRFPVKSRPPVDQQGDADTNSKRSKPYDWVLPNQTLATLEVPVVIGDHSFPSGLVFDSRAFSPLPEPILETDSEAFQMQHMAVVRDFVVPDQK